MRCKSRPKDLTDGPFRIVSNLPYNIGTALLTGWLDGAGLMAIGNLRFVDDADVSKEVAQRINAQAGEKSIMAASRFWQIGFAIPIWL